MLSSKRNMKTDKTNKYLEPYCFVRFNEHVMPSKFNRKSLPNPTDIRMDLLSGVIYYTVDALCPIVMHDIEHDYIPASSIRGLIRENLQILSFSSMREDIENRHLFFRDFSSKSAIGREYLKRTGTTVVYNSNNRKNEKIYKNIRAGILERKADGFYLSYSNNDELPSYYSINLRSLQQNNKEWRRLFNVKGETHSNVFDSLNATNFTSRRSYERKNIDPFFKKVAYSVNSKGDLTSILDLSQAASSIQEGYLLSSGISVTQHTFYLIPIPKSNVVRIKVPEDDISCYKRESRYRVQVRFRDFYELPAINTEKPVFFINEMDHISFGFTLLFPLQDSLGLHERIPTESSVDLDYSMSLFGYKTADDFYPGRLSFSSLSCQSKELVKPYSKKLNGILSMPKPQGYNNYFDSELSCKGTKTYWLRPQPINIAYDPLFSRVIDSRDVMLFPEKSSFSGQVRFFNLTKEELGLLLWSIELNSDSEQLIGGYKAYGYGRIKVKISSCHCYETASYYLNTDSFFSKDIIFDSGKRSDCIKAYQKCLSDFLDGYSTENLRLKEFFYTKGVHSEVLQDILPYSEWKATHWMQMAEISVYAKNASWAVLEKDQISSVLNHISWEEFIQNPPEDLSAIPIYHEIIDRYQVLSELLELFKQDHDYYIRKEVLDIVSSLSYFATASLRYAAHDQLNALTTYVEVIDYIDKCLFTIETITKQFDDLHALFYEETMPKISATAVKDSEKITLAITNATDCNTVYVDSITIKADKKNIIFKKYIRIQGGKTSPIELPLKRNQLILLENSHELLVDIHYMYLHKNIYQEALTKLTISFSPIKENKPALINPYSAYVKGGPVIGNNMFFGREKLLDEVISYVKGDKRNDVSGQICILYGQQRCGKSSILTHIKQELQKNREHYLVAYIGNIASIEPSESDLLGEIAFSLLEDLDSQEMSSTDSSELEKLADEIYDSEKPRRAITVFMKHIQHFIPAHKKLVLLIDEFTYLYAWITAGSIRKDFIRFWKAFIQNNDITSIIIGQDFLPDFISDYKNEFGTSKIIRVSYLDKESATDLIRVPFIRSNGFDPFTQDAIDKIIELTAGSAFYIMIICNAIVSYIDKNDIRTIDSDTIIKIVNEDLLYESSNHRIDMDIFDPLIYDGYYSEYVNDNVIILRFLSTIDKDGWGSLSQLIQSCDFIGIQDIQQKIERLEKREVISIKEGKYVYLRVKLFKLFLTRKYGEMSV